MNKKPCIHLIGDAILDNYQWLTDTKSDLKNTIVSLGYEVHNHAEEGARITNLIEGIRLSNHHGKTRSYSYRPEKDGKLYPLLSFSKASGGKAFISAYGNLDLNVTRAKMEKEHLVVLSLGGNDIMDHSASIILRSEATMETLIAGKIGSTYQQIIQQLLQQTRKIILVTLYVPYLGNGASYYIKKNIANLVADKWNRFILKMGSQFDLPVIDLRRTLDENNRAHFGTLDTQLGDLPNECLAQGINYIARNYKGHRVYYYEDCDLDRLKVEY
jgi:hypothetical protein